MNTFLITEAEGSKESPSFDPIVTTLDGNFKSYLLSPV
jgi:hypothetical protein